MGRPCTFSVLQTVPQQHHRTQTPCDIALCLPPVLSFLPTLFPTFQIQASDLGMLHASPASHSCVQNKGGCPPPAPRRAPGGLFPPSTPGPFQQNWGSAGDATAEPQLLIPLRSIHGCSQLIRLILPFVKLFISTNICCSNHHSPLTHDHITGSPRNLQLSPTHLAQHSFSPLHIEKSIRGSRCAVNVDCAYITKSETSVTMVTLKARLISRINYDKKLSMVVFKQ